MYQVFFYICNLEFIGRNKIHIQPHTTEKGQSQETVRNANIQGKLIYKFNLLNFTLYTISGLT